MEKFPPSLFFHPPLLLILCLPPPLFSALPLTLPLMTLPWRLVPSRRQVDVRYGPLYDDDDDDDVVVILGESGSLTILRRSCY